MTNKDLENWRLRIGFSKASASREIGISRTTYIKYETGVHSIPKYIALACAAISFGLPPMGSNEDD